VGGMALGADGQVWFTMYDSVGFNSPGIGKIATDGALTYFAFPPFPDFHAGRGITLGPDGNMWFTETLDFGQSDAIGRLTPGGVRTEFHLSRNGAPGGITVGPDGNLWFASFDKIGRITPSGVISYF